MRTNWLASSVVVFTLAIPMVAEPGPIVRILQFNSSLDDGDGDFDPTGASGFDGLQAPDGVFVDGMPFFLEICDAFNCDSLRLSLTWIYSFGASTLTLDGHWDSHDEPGIFVGEITSLDIELTHQCSFGLCGSTTVTLGDGVFHESLARLFGVSTITHGGSYNIQTDGAFESGGSGGGLGDNGGFGLQIVAVAPEPASILVTALGLLGVAARRRRARVAALRAN